MRAETQLSNASWKASSALNGAAQRSRESGEGGDQQRRLTAWGEGVHAFCLPHG